MHGFRRLFLFIPFLMYALFRSLLKIWKSHDFTVDQTIWKMTIPMKQVINFASTKLANSKRHHNCELNWQKQTRINEQLKLNLCQLYLPAMDYHYDLTVVISSVLALDLATICAHQEFRFIPIFLDFMMFSALLWPSFILLSCIIFLQIHKIIFAAQNNSIVLCEYVSMWVCVSLQ